jgi:predicted O-methyltransferase YrrM
MDPIPHDGFPELPDILSCRPDERPIAPGIVTRETLPLSPQLYRYLVDISVQETPVLQRLREDMANHPHSGCQIAPEQGQFMAWLVRLMQARRVIEIGVFTGYSSLWMAGAMPAHGKLIACDINREWTDIARRYWTDAGVADRIEVRLAPALQTLDELLRQDGAGSIDFMFIDAEKSEYIDYYEKGLQLLRPGGVIAVDNVLWDGRVADPADNETHTAAIRVFNAHLAGDSRVELSLVPIGDGLTLAMKR